MVIIDYLYYWFFQYYKRKCKYTDKDAELCYNSLHLSTSIAVSTVLFLILYCLFMITGCVFPLIFSINKYLIVTFALITCILTPIFTINYYKNKLSLLNERYNNNPLNKTLTGWMMFLFIMGIFLFPIVFSFIYHLLF